MTANPLRGEAEIEIGGQKHLICINMGALASISTAIGVKTFHQMAEAVVEIPNMPKVIRAVLDANGIKGVSDEQISDMDWGQYVGPFLDALLRRKANDNEAAPDPQKGQRKK